MIRLNSLTFLYLTESLLTAGPQDKAKDSLRLLGATPPPARGLRPPRPASRSSHPASPKRNRPTADKLFPWGGLTDRSAPKTCPTRGCIDLQKCPPREARHFWRGKPGTQVGRIDDGKQVRVRGPGSQKLRGGASSLADLAISSPNSGTPGRRNIGFSRQSPARRLGAKEPPN